MRVIRLRDISLYSPASFDNQLMIKLITTIISYEKSVSASPSTIYQVFGYLHSREGHNLSILWLKRIVSNYPDIDFLVNVLEGETIDREIIFDRIDSLENLSLEPILKDVVTLSYLNCGDVNAAF